MYKYDSLLQIISERFDIEKGKNEEVIDWKIRVVYTVTGLMGYASLFDVYSKDPISIDHMKKRIDHIITSYKALYPEIESHVQLETEAIKDEIEKIYRHSGVIYHKPNRIVPSMKREELFNGILFQRGISLDEISKVSGLGLYTKRDGKGNIERVRKMFGLQSIDFSKLYRKILKQADWQDCSLPENDIEYLRLTPPFMNGYWKSSPDRVKDISILRTRFKGKHFYYLYRYVDSRMEISQIPDWQVDDHQYMKIACALLMSNGKMPTITYKRDKPIVYIQLGYLLPPSELNFLKLYSWPNFQTSFPNDFSRIMTEEAFEVFRILLTEEGFQFLEL